ISLQAAPGSTAGALGAGRRRERALRSDLADSPRLWTGPDHRVCVVAAIAGAAGGASGVLACVEGIP
ncbi:MAG TPA: hypothetical protein DIT98_01415, partial [Verrucomicrobiales bacterium]|nr:hypothetical protein [Verrucomicrobiales bacterium]